MQKNTLRIAIADLPAAAPLTEEEMAGIFGAGPRRTRLGLESLETREVMAASITAALSGGVLTVQGTAGNDQIMISQTSSVINVHDGATLKASYPKVNIDSIFVNGFGGDDVVDLRGMASGQGVTLPTKLYGGDGDDTLIGGSGNDRLYGEDGDDTLTGGLGDDYLSGSTGHDTMVESGDVDMVVTNSSMRGLGNDTLNSIDEAILTGGAGDNVIDASAFADPVNLYGGAGDDTLIGSSEDDYLSGGSGDDTLVGGEGDDKLYGNSGDDTMYGNEGDDYLSGYTGDDYLSGGEGDDELYGSDGDDELYGNSGNDRLSGGMGNDHISGYTGTDTLVESADGNLNLTDAALKGSLGTDTLASIDRAELAGGAGDKVIDASKFTGSVALGGAAVTTKLNLPLIGTVSISGGIDPNDGRFKASVRTPAFEFAGFKIPGADLTVVDEKIEVTFSLFVPGINADVVFHGIYAGDSWQIDGTYPLPVTIGPVVLKNIKVGVAHDGATGTDMLILGSDATILNLDVAVEGRLDMTIRSDGLFRATISVNALKFGGFSLGNATAVLTNETAGRVPTLFVDGVMGTPGVSPTRFSGFLNADGGYVLTMQSGFKVGDYWLSDASFTLTKWTGLTFSGTSAGFSFTGSILPDGQVVNLEVRGPGGVLVGFDPSSGTVTVGVNEDNHVSVSGDGVHGEILGNKF